MAISLSRNLSSPPNRGFLLCSTSARDSVRRNDEQIIDKASWDDRYDAWYIAEKNYLAMHGFRGILKALRSAVLIAGDSVEFPLRRKLNCGSRNRRRLLAPGVKHFICPWWKALRMRPQTSTLRAPSDSSWIVFTIFQSIRLQHFARNYIKKTITRSSCNWERNCSGEEECK